MRTHSVHVFFAGLLLGAASVSAASFDEQRTAIAASVESQPEDAITNLLKAGLAENKPAPAVALANEWLRRNLPKKPELLFQAGRAAELSGEAKDAVAFYQQALKLADPKSVESGEAIAAVHALLVNQLDNPGGAYAFGLNEAETLAVNPRFRQLDRWFLDTAIASKNGEAVARRLLATVKAGVSDDQLVALYSGDFRWLLSAVDGYVEQPNTTPFTQELYEAVKDLSEAIRFDEDLRLQLDWAVSVKAYNLAQLGGASAPKISRRAGKKKGAVVAAETGSAVEKIAPPIAEATALLAKYPHHAKWVQDGWAGGGNGQHYRNDPKKYWTEETDAKMAPIIAALPKLTPLQLDDFIQSWSTGYYRGGPEVMVVKAAREFLLGRPELMNRRTGPFFIEKPWNQLTVEEAAKLAPQLANNSDPQASLVRAIAAGGKDLDKVMAALLGPEAWRLSAAELGGAYADQLWHYCGRPGEAAKRDAEIAKTKAFAATIPVNELDAKAPAAQRSALFKQLWDDYTSAAPKIPSVRARLAKVLCVTPEVVPQLLADTRSEAAFLLREVLATDLLGPDGPLSGDPTIFGIITDRYTPLITRKFAQHGVDLQKRVPKSYVPHPLEPVLRASVASLLKQNKAENWLTLAWINAQFPENNADSVKLMEELFRSPAFATLSFETRYSARTWFAEKAMTPAQFAILQSADPKLVCKDLLALPKEADAAKTTAALEAAINGIRKSPFWFEIQGLENLAAVSDAVFADAKVLSLCVEMSDSLRSFMPTSGFGNRFFKEVSTKKDQATLLRTSAYHWQHIEMHHRTYPDMLTLAESLVDEQPSAASALALCGLATIERHKTGHTWFKRETDVPRLKAIRGKAAMKLGLIVIPVPVNHPAYPVYQSQAEWMAGNEDSAWSPLDPHWEVFMQTHRELSVPYLMWVLQRTIYGRDEARQETLVKSLLGWAAEAGSPLTATEKAKVEIAYGDIALQRGQLREAHEIYSRVQKNTAYAGLMIRHEAALRRVRAERIGKNFDAALQTLMDLELERVPEIWTDTRFARAEVHFDMEEFNDAKDDIDSILARDPNHADSRILLGKVQLKRQKLMEATEVELGSTTGQTSLVPGENLKVTLSDPTLAVSGAGTEIEVVVWAKSGDKETFFLRQFGDEKTKFRGEVPTMLGAPAAADGKLQVIGDDEVFYAYSEAFRQKMNLSDEKRGGPIIIASDAVLMASARKLLTDAEQRSADMQAMMDKIGLKAGKGAHLESAAKAQMATESLESDKDADPSRHITQIAKPGNPVHVRVIDSDRSRSAGIDELTVSVSSSSGDSISRVTLRETGTHSGWFEGSIPTAGAQAQAYAQNSEPGRVPNMVISPNKDYPAWRPVATKGVLAAFTVDFNDNIEPGALTITASEKGAALKKFIVQTAMNDKDWTSIATFPETKALPANPWLPTITVVNENERNHHNGARPVHEIDDLRQHMATGWLAHQPDMAIAKNVKGPSEALPASIPTDVKWQRSRTWPNPAVVACFKAYFHEKEPVLRRFSLNLGNIPDLKIPADNNQKSQPAGFLIAVNGKVITDPKNNQLVGEINLDPGIHKIEIWATGWLSQIGFGREMKLSANLENPDALTACPDSIFDPATFPPALVDPRNAPAAVSANAAGTEFQVKFAKDSRARLLRIVMVEQEGPVPALNKLALTSPDGKQVLPVAQDFAELNKNDTLEILTGDKISVRYVDDRFVTKTKERQERFLNVSFTDARVEFADMEPRINTVTQEDIPYYEKLLRFPHDKPLTLAIHDADMDVSVQPDKVKVTLETNGGTKQFDATETGDSTGIFKLVVTPVSNKSADANQFQVSEGGVITARYLDHENNRPGVPTERVTTIRHAAFTLPQIVLSHAAVTPLERGETNALHQGFAHLDDTRPNQNHETIRQGWHLTQTMHPAEKPPEGGFQSVLGQRVFIELIAPQFALGENSTVTVYAQTDSGRKDAQGFDINAPGTVLVDGLLRGALDNADPWKQVPLLPIYQVDGIAGFRENPEMDRFRLTLPLIVGVLPAHGALTLQERYDMAKQARESITDTEAVDLHFSGLVVRPGERVHIGFRYTDREGKEQWITASTQVVTHPAFDLMAEDFRAPMTSAYVGENLNLRVVDLGADVSNAPDTVRVLMQSKSGAKQQVELNETGPHTGIFKAGYQLSYSDGKTPAEPLDVRQNGFPVTYGDTVAARYTDAKGVKTDIRQVTISKGADGTIAPFSKKYDDPQIAMRTQFSLAEAYLEVAKRHRKLNESEAAALGYESAKQLLSKAMDQFTDPETRAHAEYLLGTLTMEEADTAEDAEIKESRYRAALSRFLNVTGSYSKTLHASKAQYQIAMIYERLKEPDIAAQEYVKLAYKYPDSEFLATSMARLGTHFLKKANEYEQQAKPLLEKAKAEENKDAQFEGDALMKMAVAEYLKTAKIFGRLQERFPSDSLAGQAGLRAGQSYMRAGKNQEAVDAFQRVIAEQSYDGKSIRAQAMYWAGMGYQSLKQPMAAYSIYKRLTYDFPESEWAAFARGQLSQEGLLDLESKLELERLEGEKQ
jgi:tetratricopeptide (TPR) repeat protein